VEEKEEKGEMMMVRREFVEEKQDDSNKMGDIWVN